MFFFFLLTCKGNFYYDNTLLQYAKSTLTLCLQLTEVVELSSGKYYGFVD